MVFFILKYSLIGYGLEVNVIVESGKYLKWLKILFLGYVVLFVIFIVRIFKDIDFLIELFLSEECLLEF